MIAGIDVRTLTLCGRTEMFLVSTKDNGDGTLSVSAVKTTDIQPARATTDVEFKIHNLDGTLSGPYPEW